jgi:hypothetical protein
MVYRNNSMKGKTMSIVMMTRKERIIEAVCKQKNSFLRQGLCGLGWLPTQHLPASTSQVLGF